MTNTIDRLHSETVLEEDGLGLPTEVGKDIFNAIDVPESLTRYITRISLADCPEPISFCTAVPPTGATYLDMLFRGELTHTCDSVLQRRTLGELNIAGQIRNEDIQMNYSGRIGQVVIHFAPLGNYELLGVTGQSAAGRVANAAKLSERTGQLVSELSEIVASKSADQTAELSLAAITRHLTDYARKPLPAPKYLHDAVAIAERSHGAVRVSKIADEVGVSERQLSREFSRLVGLPPKFYCRVLQINTALANMLRGEGEQMIDVALQRDFADQSHFNRVFRQFLKMNPREYLYSDELMLSHFLANWQGPHRA